MMGLSTSIPFYVSFFIFRKVQLGEQKDDFSTSSEITEELSVNPKLNEAQNLGSGGGSSGIDRSATFTDIDLSGISDGNCIVNLRHFLSEVSHIHRAWHSSNTLGIALTGPPFFAHSHHAW